MTASENTLASGKFFRFWSAANEPRAVVLISHGLGEHSRRYEHVAAALTADNLDVYAPDHIGHGKSPGKPAYIDRFSDLTSGVSELRDHIRRHHAGLPVILIGHSMGGLIAIRLALGAHADYAGLILTGPLLGQPEAPSRLQVMLLRVLSVLAPKVKAIEIDASAVSRDPAVVSDYIADPLVHHDNIPARTLVSLLDETAQVMNEASSLQLPVLLLHGAEDKLTSVTASEAFFEKLGSVDKKITVYDGLFHELFNEPEQDSILQTCSEWINARL